MQVLAHERIIEEYLLDMKREINASINYTDLTRRAIQKLGIVNYKSLTRLDIMKVLDTLRKTEESDPLHKWIGTYNLYIVILKRFFKWLGNVECMEGIKKLKRKEKSIYKPSDLWTVEDDLLFLKYCNNKRDKAYHAMSRDSSCRPSELLKLKIKDVLFKQASGKQYAEILVNGKTGTRHIPLFHSIPYLKDWLDEYPFSNNPNAPLLSGLKQSLGRHIHRTSLHETYTRYKEQYFPKLLSSPAIAPEEKQKIEALLKKPWNPYIRRHSALTEKAKNLKEPILKLHAGWSPNSQMHLKYEHWFGNESNDAILESWGLKTKPDEINKMQPVQCPNCGESNKIDSKFCAKCRMVLTYDSYQEVTEELETRFTNEEFMILKNISDHFGKIGSDKFNEFLKNNDKEKIRGVKKALNQKGDYVKVGEDKENGVVFVEYTEDEERIKADRMAWKKEHESDESG